LTLPLILGLGQVSSSADAGALSARSGDDHVATTSSGGAGGPRGRAVATESPPQRLGQGRSGGGRYGWEGSTQRAALTTISGRVAALGREPAEGGVAVVTLALLPPPGAARPLPRIFLAPEPVLAELGLSIAVGDTICARVFRAEAGSAKAHTLRVLNRDSWIRLRTLRRRPLWTSDGWWLGGPLRHGRGRGRRAGCGREHRAPRCEE
jgi:hypothetical protein